MQPSLHDVRLEAENLVLQLAGGSCLGESERLGGFLHSADHRRGSTDEDLDIVGGSREPLLKAFVRE